MRIMNLVRPSVALALGFALFGLTGQAHAEDEFDVAVDHGHIVVHAKGKWHINKEYPWKLVIGGEKIGRERFELSEKSASVEAPKGAVVTLKGGVCNGDQCMRLEKSVTMP